MQQPTVVNLLWIRHLACVSGSVRALGGFAARRFPALLGNVKICKAGAA